MYNLIENGKLLHKSGDFAKLLNYTAKTENAVIFYNGSLVWAQNPTAYIK